MTKECPVIRSNADVAVVLWDDIEIQIPAVGSKIKSVKMQRVGNTYRVAKEDPAEDRPKMAEKKTTKYVQEETAVVSDDKDED